MEADQPNAENFVFLLLFLLNLVLGAVALKMFITNALVKYLFRHKTSSATA